MVYLRVALAWLLLVPAILRADVRLPAIIGDNMVLQRESDVPMWGWAAPGEKITVTLGEQKATATADEKGKWMAHLKDLKAGGPHEVVIQGQNTITLKNVLVGEVWICAGQSNMQAQMGWLGEKPDIAAADNPQIRLFVTPIWLSPQPLENVKGQWVVCTPQTVKALSAVGYYFGREIQDKTKVPVGMINTASGGSTAQTWISEGAFKGNEKLGGPADISSPNVKSFYDRLESYQKARTEWETAAAEAKVQKKPAPPQPASPLVGSGYPPSGTYNAMLAPIAPYGVRGAIWYQGEANTGYPAIYAKVMSLLIDDWRRAFNRPEMPFLLVQLPAFNPDNVPPGNWAALREQQVKITKDVPNTGMAVTIDVGDPKDIHPKNKKPVGYRLALVALKNVYKKDLVSSGPTYDSMKVDGNRIRLTLGNIGGGLVTSDGKDVAGFTIAGADHVFVPAQAKIEGGQVIVWSDDVGDPQAARYAWADYPTCNLANKEGLPAGPFRTDDWPLTRPTTRGR